MDPQELRTAERRLQSILDQLVECPRAERADTNNVESPIAQRTIEPERYRAARPHGEQEPNGATLESSSCEVKDSGCGEVEPLNVIDSDQNRPRHGKLRQHCDGRGRNGPLTGNRIGAASLQKCYLERIALRRWKRRDQTRLDTGQ